MQSETLLKSTQPDLDEAVKKTGTENMEMFDNEHDCIVDHSKTGRKPLTNNVFVAAVTTQCCKIIDHGDGIPFKTCRAKPPGGCRPGWHEE